MTVIKKQTAHQGRRRTNVRVSQTLNSGGHVSPVPPPPLPTPMLLLKKRLLHRDRTSKQASPYMHTHAGLHLHVRYSVINLAKAIDSAGTQLDTVEFIKGAIY